MNLTDIVNLILNIFKSASKKSSASVVEPSFDGTHLMLARDTFLDVCTLGVLTIGDWSCQMIELPKASYNGSNVLIPTGTFELELYDSPTHGKVPQLKEVPNRTYIQIHKSNWAIRPSDNKVFLLGCLAPGLSRGENYVNSSEAAWNQMMAHIDWSKKVQITITE